MRRRRRGAVRWCGAVLGAVALVAWGPVSPAVADGLVPHTYDDASYSPDFASPPTDTEIQSAVWFYGTSWWALMLDPTGRTVRVNELMPDHTWRATDAVVNTDAVDAGDALPDGDTVHVVTRRQDTGLQHVLLTFDPAIGDYRAGEPSLITHRGALKPATIAKDTAGRLWVGWATETEVTVVSSKDLGRNWGDVIVLAPTGTGATPETAALVAYSGSVGILWSDQATQSFRFASHRDGDDPTVWTYEVAAQGPALADNHISLRRVPAYPSDVLVAAVKTSAGDAGEASESPLIEVLVRSRNGEWSTRPAATIADGLNNPVLSVDEESGTLYLFAAGHGAVVMKQSPLDDISFAPGLGEPFVLGGPGELVSPTTAKQSVDARSGLLVLASDIRDRNYRHAESPLPGAAVVADPDDRTPPSVPTHVEGRPVADGTVVLSWQPSSDGDRWVPAGEGVPVAGYAIRRDGVDVGIVTSTSFQDDAAPSDRGQSLTYEIQAVDAAGNRSAPARVVVTLPADDSLVPRIAGISVLVLAPLAAFLAYRRMRLRQGQTLTGRPLDSRPARGEAGSKGGTTPARPPALRS